MKVAILNRSLKVFGKQSFRRPVSTGGFSLANTMNVSFYLQLAEEKYSFD
jgi:hypothetical protein